MSTYKVLEVLLEPDSEELASFVLMESKSLGCYCTSESPLLVKLTAYFNQLDFNDELLALIQAGFRQYRVNYQIDNFKTYDLADSNWLLKFNETLKPLDIANNLTVVPVVENRAFTLNPTRVNILIEPAMAFGTGLHATTQFCLSQVEKYANNSRFILDFGCGSGILAIAGAIINKQAFVTAIDNDEIAVLATKKNAKLNNIDQNFDVLHGDLNTLTSGKKYDLLLANLTAQVLEKYLPKLTNDFLKPKSILILSGILTQYSNLVLDVCPDLGLDLRLVENTGEWTHLVLQKAI